MDRLESVRFRRSLRAAVHDAVTRSVRQVLEDYGLSKSESRVIHFTPQLPDWYAEWSELLNNAFQDEYQRITWKRVFEVLGVEDTPEHRDQVKPIMETLDFRRMTVVSEDGLTRVNGWARGRSHRGTPRDVMREITG